MVLAWGRDKIIIHAKDMTRPLAGGFVLSGLERNGKELILNDTNDYILRMRRLKPGRGGRSSGRC